jgi:hypothetical protein
MLRSQHPSPNRYGSSLFTDNAQNLGTAPQSRNQASVPPKEQPLNSKSLFQADLGNEETLKNLSNSRRSDLDVPDELIKILSKNIIALIPIVDEKIAVNIFLKIVNVINKNHEDIKQGDLKKCENVLFSILTIIIWNKNIEKLTESYENFEATLLCLKGTDEFIYSGPIEYFLKNLPKNREDIFKKFQKNQIDTLIGIMEETIEKFKKLGCSVPKCEEFRNEMSNFLASNI